MTIEEIIKELKDRKGMPTIEERAKAYSKTQAIECYAYCGYERGAIEQRDIDIERAWLWMLSHIKLIGSKMELHSQFSKAMKGE